LFTRKRIIAPRHHVTMAEELPPGWVRTTLGEIAALSKERILPADAPDLPYVGLEHIEPQTMRLLHNGYGRDVRSSSLRFSKNDVLYGKMRPYLNKVWVAEFDGICSGEFLVFKRMDEVDSRFLACRLNSEDFVAFANRQVSGERPRVNFEKLSGFPILLPPIAEQERILARLSAASSGLARAQTPAHRAQGRLKLYYPAVLHAAITGELTQQWRKKKKDPGGETGAVLLAQLLSARRAHWEEAEMDRMRLAAREPKDDKWKSRYREPSVPDTGGLPRLPAGWAWATVEQIGEVRLGRQRSPQHHSGKYMRPYLRVANVFEDHIDTSDVKRMNFTPEEFEIYRLEEGDILLNEGQSLELVGRPAMYQNELPGSCFQNTLVRFRSFEAVNRNYALIVFRAYLHGGRFQRIAKITTNLAHLGADRFSHLEFPVPPLAEQAEIVREVDRRLSAAQQLEMSLGRQLVRAREARQSLFREAFTGRLLPQDPNDEPASVLLKRIASIRDAESGKLRTGNMPKPKSKGHTERRPLLDVLREHNEPMTPEHLFREAGYEREFKETRYSQEVVDLFYLELRRLTEPPTKIRQQNPSTGVILLEAIREA
jgi:type I restriction enzyme S subunit